MTTEEYLAWKIGHEAEMAAYRAGVVVPAWMVVGAFVCLPRLDKINAGTVYRVERIRRTTRCASGYCVRLQKVFAPFYVNGKEVDMTHCQVARLPEHFEALTPECIEATRFTR